MKNRVPTNGATGAAAPQAKSKSKPHIEYAGKQIVSSFWLKLGVSREELYALHQIAEGFKGASYRTPGHAAALVLTSALMHWEKLEPLIFADQQYSKAEGFLHSEIFQAQTIARKFKLKIPVDRRGVVSRNKR